MINSNPAPNSAGRNEYTGSLNSNSNFTIIWNYAIKIVQILHNTHFRSNHSFNQFNRMLLNKCIIVVKLMHGTLCAMTYTMQKATLQLF